MTEQQPSVQPERINETQQIEKYRYVTERNVNQCNVTGLVDPAVLICPGCEEQAQAVHDAAGEQFSHSDETELCRARGGRPGEPVER